MMKRRSKKLIQKVVHYLKSDSYLFAPLISSKPLNYFKPRKGIEIREPTKDNRSLVKKIKEYLKSDCYMYASLVLPQSSTISPKGSIECVNNLEVDWKKTSIMKLDDRIVKESVENRTFEEAEQQKKLLEEPLESTIYANCRSSPRSGGRERMVFDHRIRKIVVD